MAPEILFPLAGKRLWIAGHRGMVGQAIVRRLATENCEILTAGREEVDLLNQDQVSRFLADTKPDGVIMAAAKVGGILANDTYPANFLYENVMMTANVIHGSHEAGVRKLLFLGSSCIYPKFADQPIREDALLTGPLEPTNEWYAIAKITGVKLCQAYRRQHGSDFISAMPTNLYGPGDNFDLKTSHVLPALIRKAHDAKEAGAKEMTIWGSGTPKREFLYVDDCADALVHLMKHYSDESHVNVGCGNDLTIAEVAQKVITTVGLNAKLVTDPSKPDGTPRKLLDISKLIATGWQPRISLEDGLARTYEWYLSRAAGRE